ncbi:MAG: DUF559 domain-containing protein [Rhodococcus sp. (in: high G+C Gram-positive bacteria)]|uniref:endonuclease domain-containing protein n=1 Tax=Rhodococcus sp. EPR-157 TaxID=1813677 RepID=UPI0007BB6364|nr:DUF559 domain-containing protein [Rhodococcus sp. EPR-157]KZF03886.1 hypothetical protein A2J03_27700 [Rhodococcus sp. EPR-157]
MRAQDDAAWYARLPDNRATHLRGVDAHRIAASLDPLPDDAPAVATIHIADVDSQRGVVTTILDGIETAVLEAFPAWLPGGEHVEGPNRLDLLAAQKLSLDLASTSDHFGPFVIAMSQAAILGRPIGRRFIDQTRAEGLRRLLAETYHRRSVALVVSVEAGQSRYQQSQLVAGCVWLAVHGGFAVWIVSPDDFDSDHIRSVDISIAGPYGTSPSIRRVHIPALAGRPHPGSTAEKKLERALASCEWAFGREWNRPFQASPLHEAIVVDLRWPAEKCVIEVDGDDHRHPIKFARDRQRDVVLQLDGYAVLRFTNAQIIDDVAAVVSAIETYIRNKRDSASRTAQIEGTPRGE